MKRMGKLFVVSGLAFTVMMTGAEAAPKGPTLVDVALELNTNTNSLYYGVFDTLIAAVLAADPAVVATLSGNGQYTVFAPTDDAFADLGLNDANVGGLPQEALTEVLLYHVAHGRRDAEDVLDSSRIRTLLGGFVLQSGGVLTDAVGEDSNIIVTDVPAANGIIHAIDAVLLPYEL